MMPKAQRLYDLSLPENMLKAFLKKDLIVDDPENPDFPAFKLNLHGHEYYVSMGLGFIGGDGDPVFDDLSVPHYAALLHYDKVPGMVNVNAFNSYNKKHRKRLFSLIENSITGSKHFILFASRSDWAAAATDLGFMKGGKYAL